MKVDAILIDSFFEEKLFALGMHEHGQRQRLDVSISGLPLGQAHPLRPKNPMAVPCLHHSC